MPSDHGDPWLDADGDRPPRPVAVTIMGEHCGGPVWDRPYGSGEPLYDLVALGVPDGLIERLRDWNGQLEATALTGFAFESPQAEADWVRHGRDLAFELQDVLWDVEVHYWEGPDRSRPVRG